VHRLDRHTTGVIIVAKNDTAHWKLSRQFAERTNKKTYLAVVHGAPELDGDCIDVPLGVHPVIREKYSIRPDIGKQAVTFYRVLERFRGYSLVELYLKTGRTHQIRVHLAAIRHPCAGDIFYGADPALASLLGLRRQWLHAVSLSFPHPRSGALVSFTSPYPADLAHALEVLR